MFDEDSQLWIHLSGLPMRLTEGDLACILSQYGEILELSLLRQDGNVDSTKSCFIKYESARNCDRAVQYLHGTTLLGNKLDVIYAEKLHAKRKGSCQKEVDGETKDINSSLGGDSRVSSEEDLINNIRDTHLVKSDCLSNYVNLKLAKDKTSKQSNTYGREMSNGREVYHSSSTKHHHPEPSSSTRSSSKHRISHSPTRSSRSGKRTPSLHERELPLRYRDSYSPNPTRCSKSSTVHRYREDSPTPRRHRSSPISPIRWIRTRNSSSPAHRRIQNPSSPNDRRSRENRESRSPRRRHYSSRSSPQRECDTYRRYEYVRDESPHRYSSRYLHHYASGRYRRSTSRCHSRSPGRERSRSRHWSSSQLRDRSRSNHRDRASRSPSSSGRPDRVSSTSQMRSRSCQRDSGSKEWRSHSRKQIDDREHTQERGRTLNSEIRSGKVGATGISSILERRLSRHYETNGV